MPFIEESSLWPVLIVFIGHGMAISAPVLLLAVRDRQPVGILGLMLLVGWSAAIVRYDLRRTRSRGGLTLVLAITWALGVSGAWLADKYLIF